MGHWEYGGSWERHPVIEGQVASREGCALLCGSIMDPEYDGAGLFQFGAPDMVYADPPWSSGVIKAYYTKAKLDNPPAYEELIQRMLDLCRQHAPEANVFVEGSEETPALEAVLDGNGLVWHSVPTTYYRKSPARIWAFNMAGGPPPPLDAVAGMDDEDIPGLLMDQLRPRAVYDPFTGRGLTARSAVSRGIPFMGSELNPKRLAVLHEWLYKQTRTKD